MTDTPFVYWRSVNGSHWILTDVLPTSLVGRWLAEHPDQIYDDGYGNRYRCDKAVRS